MNHKHFYRAEGSFWMLYFTCSCGSVEAVERDLWYELTVGIS